jgi:hypothetical protein
MKEIQTNSISIIMKNMKKLAIIVFLAIVSSQVFSQSKTYFSTGGEIIFSLAAIDNTNGYYPDGNSEGNVVRFSPFFCIQPNFNIDFNKNIGSYIGLSIRNIGFIYDQWQVPNPEIPGETKMLKKKFRTYNLGLPVGLKFGLLDKVFVYGGYEIEFPFNYKEKTFDGDQKSDKFNVWFSDRVEQFQHGFFAGIQLPYGANLKFKYYLSNFHNMDYVNNDGVKPYNGLKSNVFYFALSFDPFKNMHETFSDTKEKKSYY